MCYSNIRSIRYKGEMNDAESKIKCYWYKTNKT